IMGVGEEESLEGSISITVIATGFNVEQQNEIVNTETKKIIHTLEDEQRAEQTLTPKATASAVRLPEKPISSQPKAEVPVVKHTLFDEPEIEEKLPFEGYIKTSELLKNLHVSYEEVEVRNLESFSQVEVNKINVNEFVIIETAKKQEEQRVHTIETVSEEVEDQILMFDLPINSSSNKMVENERKDESVFFELGDIEVQDHVEIIPITEV